MRQGAKQRERDKVELLDTDGKFLVSAFTRAQRLIKNVGGACPWPLKQQVGPPAGKFTQARAQCKFMQLLRIT